MAVYLMAPWGLEQTTVMLPNPQLGDLRNKILHVNIRNSIDGTLYSYKKSNTYYYNGQVYDKYKLSWEFLLRRGKADELFEFVRAYSGYKWRVIDWKERVYIVDLLNDPVDFDYISSSGIHSVRLDLEGPRIVLEPNPNEDVQQ